MATNPNELAPTPGEGEGEGGEGGQQQPDPNANPQGGEGGEGEGDPDPVEALALEMGWTPKDKFNGPEDKWRDAASFIKAGRDIQRGYADEVKSLRSQMDVVARTSAQLLEDRLAEQRRELTEQFNAAVEEGDSQRAFRLGNEIQNLGAKAPRAGPDPTVEDWVSRNAWFNADPAAKARAVQVSNELAATGADTAAQLRAAERVIRAEYPEHFQNERNGHQTNGQRAPHVSAPAGRSATPGSNRQRGFSDLPKAAQDIAIDMANRGVIPSKEAYADRYWQNAGEKR